MYKVERRADAEALFWDVIRIVGANVGSHVLQVLLWQSYALLTKLKKRPGLLSSIRDSTVHRIFMEFGRGVLHKNLPNSVNFVKISSVRDMFYFRRN
jgi:hypothetical protein